MPCQSEMASPLTGCGVPVNRFWQIFLAQYKNGDTTAEKLAASTQNILSRQGQKLVYQEKTLETPEETFNGLKKMTEEFLANNLPTFKALLIA